MKLLNKKLFGGVKSWESDESQVSQRDSVDHVGTLASIVLVFCFFIFFHASPTSAQMVYVGNSLSATNGNEDGIPPLVILGEYSPSGPLSSSTVTLPAGVVQDVKFYGADYNFILYALALVTNGPSYNEETFQVVAEEGFTNEFAGTAVTNILPVTNFTVNAGDFLAFCGTGPYYPKDVDGDATNSDATYQNSDYAGFGMTTAPGGPGSQFTVGTFMDFNATYGYVPDVFTNQGRSYAFGVDCLSTNGFTFITLAGRGTINGNTDGLGTNALFNDALGTAVASNFDIFVADSGNNRIREVTTVETNWLATTMAGSNGFGSADGIGTNAQFYNPEGIAVTSNETVIVADTFNDTIRMLTLTNNSWMARTIAGLARTPGTNDGSNNVARFFSPEGVAVDFKTNIYVADTTNHIIRKITLVKTNWVVTTIAGLAQTPGFVDATNSMARFDFPEGIAVDKAGNLYVADTGNNRIREIIPTGNIWTVTTIAGGATNGSADGTGTNASFNAPGGIAVDAFNDLYVTDTGNDTIRSIIPYGGNWIVNTVGGLARTNGYVDGTGPAARFTGPRGISVNGLGNLFLDEDVIVGGISPLTSVKYASYNVEVVLGPQSADIDGAGWKIVGQSSYAPGQLSAQNGQMPMQTTNSMPVVLVFKPVLGWAPPSGLASAVTNIPQSQTEFIAVNDLSYTAGSSWLYISNDKSLWMTGALNTTYNIQYNTNLTQNNWKNIPPPWTTKPLLPGENYITNWQPALPSSGGTAPAAYYRAQWTGN